MANRVLLGSRSGGAGFFVSRPGVNVLTASGDDLLLSTLDRNLQIVASGVINRSSGSQTITWGSLGYRPIVVLVGQNQSYYVYNNDNSATVYVFPNDSNMTYWITSNKPTLSNRIEWLALRPGI